MGKKSTSLLWKEKVSYGMEDCGANVTVALCSTFLTAYYTDKNCIVYTANNLPYNALLSRMTLNVQDRASAASLRFVMTQITTLLINAVTAGLLLTVGWFWLSLVYGIITLILCLICFWGTREHIGEDVKTGMVKVESVPLQEALPALLKNRYFYLQSLLFMFLYIGIVSTGSTTFYFCNIVLNNIGYLTFVSMATTIPAIIVNLVLPNIIRKYGKWKLMVLGAGLMTVGSVIVGAAGSNFPLVLLGLVVKGMGMGPIMSGIFAMTADVVDYGEWKTGIRSEGLVNCCTSFGMKVGIGLGAALCTWLISMGGYDGAAAIQTESAVNMIRFGFGYNGAVIGVVCLVLCFLMNIDKDIVAIQRDLETKRK